MLSAGAPISLLVSCLVSLPDSCCCCCSLTRSLFFSSFDSVEPPGINPLFTTAHPWWDRYIFTSINTCLDRCNSTNRTCLLLGEQDAFGAWEPYNQTVPYKIYHEVINDTLKPKLYPNQTDAIVISGSPGMELDAAGHNIDNPQCFPFTVQGVYFVQPSSQPTVPTWDQGNGNINETTCRMTWNSNAFDGRGSPAMYFNGPALDTAVVFENNIIDNYTGPLGGVFNGRDCANSSTIEVLNNLIAHFAGNALIVSGYDSATVNDNKCLQCKSSSAVNSTSRFTFWFSPCLNNHTGSWNIQRTYITSPTGQTCTAPYWSSVYIDPFPSEYKAPYTDPQLPYDVKSIYISDTQTGQFGSTTDIECVGIRIANAPVVCDFPDPKAWLRNLIYFHWRNNRAQGLVWDLYFGPFNAAQETNVLTNPDALGNKCRWCNDGCIRHSYDTLGWWIGGIVLFFLACCCCCWFAGGGAVFFCWPKPPPGWHMDEYLETSIPTDRNKWYVVPKYGPNWNGDDPRHSIPLPTTNNPTYKSLQQRRTGAVAAAGGGGGPVLIPLQ